MYPAGNGALLTLGQRGLHDVLEHVCRGVDLVIALQGQHDVRKAFGDPGEGSQQNIDSLVECQCRDVQKYKSVFPIQLLPKLLPDFVRSRTKNFGRYTMRDHRNASRIRPGAEQPPCRPFRWRQEDDL